MADPPRRHLTKSLVRTALSCPRKLEYATNPNTYPPRSPDAVENPLLKHISKEGKRFGEYCTRLFPHGVNIEKCDPYGSFKGRQRVVSAPDSLASLEDRVIRTRHALFGGHRLGGTNNERVTVFEGALSYGPFYAQPDILDKLAKTGESIRTELRLIEVKSKSWDTRYSVQSKMLNSSKKRVKSLYSLMIQDVAFQTMVCRLAYPESNVSSWLMMPDKAKKMKCNPNHYSSKFKMPTTEDTSQMIRDSIACLINVDDLVEIALASEVSYPGSRKGETFENAVQHWAEQLNDKGGFGSCSTPVGQHCASCEYRLTDTCAGERSGFDVCWENASSIDVEKLRSSPLILDLFGKKSVESFLSEGKYIFSDLSARDFDLLEDGTPINDGKDKMANENVITSPQRQWYQVQTSKRQSAIDKICNPSYVIRRNGLQRSMKKWRYPLHFIDFETISPVIPHYLGGSPYQISAFQFSHHTLSQDHDGSFTVRHESEFLHTDAGTCPNGAFLKALSNAIGNAATESFGTVFQWSPHETTVLRALLSSPDATSSLTPGEISSLSRVAGSMVDLCKLARRYYYVDGSGGSSSIKHLLRPTLDASARLRVIYGSPTYQGRNFRNFQWYQLDEHGCSRDPYDILSGESLNGHSATTIADGGNAVMAFSELQNNTSLEIRERDAIFNSLRRYCELDTLAMVMIVQAWQGFLEDEP